MDMESYYECMFWTKCIGYLKDVIMVMLVENGFASVMVRLWGFSQAFLSQMLFLGWIQPAYPWLLYGYRPQCLRHIVPNNAEKCFGALEALTPFYFLTVCSDCFLSTVIPLCVRACVYTALYIQTILRILCIQTIQRIREQRVFMSVEFLKGIYYVQVEKYIYMHIRVQQSFHL